VRFVEDATPQADVDVLGARGIFATAPPPRGKIAPD